MANLFERGKSVLIWFAVWVLSVVLLGLAGSRQSEAAFVDAIVAEVNGVTVAASDIGLARSLGLFGFSSSRAPIDGADIGRFIDVLLVLGEAARLEIEGLPGEMERRWRLVAERAGGLQVLEA